MLSLLAKVPTLISRLHRNERGDVPIGTILVVAFIVIPIIILLVLFKDELLELFNTQADSVIETGEENMTPSR